MKKSITNFIVDKFYGGKVLKAVVNSTLSTETINTIKQHTIYPIYYITIEQGTYTSKSFIEETTKMFSPLVDEHIKKLKICSLPN